MTNILHEHSEVQNQKSFIQQKFNLRSSEANEIFFIPTFTLISAPIKSAENTNFYELLLQISYFYWENYSHSSNILGVIYNLIFQYDLNYSKVTTARGQIKLFNDLEILSTKNSAVSGQINTKVASKNSKQDMPLANQKIFKILLPVKAINKNDINVLHYSFNASKRKSFFNMDFNTNTNLHVNNDDNSGTLDFNINNQPQYHISTAPEILSKKINILTIENPLIFQTFIPRFNNSYNLISNKNLAITWGYLDCQPLITENFTFLYNNLNSLAVIPFKVQYYLKIAQIKNFYFQNSVLKALKNFIIHQGEFNLQQNPTIDILKTKNLKIKKIITTLTINNYVNDDIHNLNFQEYLFKINDQSYNPFSKKFVNDFLDLYHEKLDFVAHINFKFKTFFDFNVDIDFFEHSSIAIIGEENSMINTIITKQKFKNIKWMESDNIVLSYSQIKQYYLNDNFNFDEYLTLKSDIKNDLSKN